MMVATCPYCGVDLEEYDIYDTEMDISVYQYVVGGCPECGRTFQWENKFEYVGFQNLRETKGE